MAFDKRNPNLRVWFDNEETDPAYTKPITGKAFKGTALNGTYVIKRLTDAFGPVGFGWGYEAEFEDVHLPSGMSLNFCTISFWYFPNGCELKDGLLVQRGARSSIINQVGGTQLAGKFSSGKDFADDEARKKSLTDALLKVASHLGIGGDIHLGMFDDSKYVEHRAAEAQKQQAAVDRDTAISEANELTLALVGCDAEVFAELRGNAVKIAAALKDLGLTKERATLIDNVTKQAAALGIELRTAA